MHFIALLRGRCQRHRTFDSHAQHICDILVARLCVHVEEYVL